MTAPASERRLCVVIPVFNEAPNLERLFSGLSDVRNELAGHHLEITLVDDGSSDGTPELARRLGETLGVRVLEHGRNRGPGHAFGTAFEQLAGELRDDDLVITMEGDNTSRTELIAAMLRRVDEGHDAVFASPYMYGGGITHTEPMRIFLSHIANIFVKEFFGVHGLLTVSSFFRLYRGAALMRLQDHYGPRVIERAGFESMLEVVLKMVYLDMSISELPMVLDTSRRAGKSKMKIRKTALGYGALLGRKRDWQRRAQPADA